MSNRIKAHQITSDAELHACLSEAAKLDTFAQQTRLTLKQRIQELQDDYNPQAKAAEAESAALLARAEAYCRQHRERLFAKQTADSPLCTFGFRRSTVLAHDFCDQDGLIAAMRDDAAPGIDPEQFIEVKERVADSAVKRALKASGEVAGWLSRFFRIREKETFGITPKTEEITRRKS